MRINGCRYLPVLVLFLALQRFYLRGIMLGSIKG